MIRTIRLGMLTFAWFVPLAVLADGKRPVPPSQPPALTDVQSLGQIQVPTLEQARKLAQDYVLHQADGKAKWAAIESLWAAQETRTLLDRTVDSLSQVDPAIAELVTSIRQQPGTSLLRSPVLQETSYTPYVKDNLKLFLARALTNKRLHEDALALLRSLTPEQLIDPASYYFYRAVCENKLRLKEDGLLSARRLLSSMQNTAPERYLVVTTLMQDEMQKWEDQDLGDVARRMEEIEGRLDNAQGGAKTQEKQKEVINMLDKLIKDMENQCQQCNKSSPSQGQAKTEQHAQDSKVMNGAGKGEVENKKLILTADVWGKMPEKEKVKALEAVNRQLPAHIREAAEGFTKKLQTGGK